MASFAAVFHRSGEPIHATIFSGVFGVVRRDYAAGGLLHPRPNVILAVQDIPIDSAEFTASGPLHDSDQRYAIVADVRLDNRQELKQRLHLDTQDDSVLSDAQLLRIAYAAWSTECVNHLLGDYAFAIWDELEQTLFVARDSLGVRQVYYYVDSDKCVASTHIDAILAHPEVILQINEARVAEYLAGIWDNEEESFYKDIHYCPPGCYLLVSSEAHQVQRYWQLDPGKRIRYRDPADYAAHFLSILKQSVSCRMSGKASVGISLSGGLDSTSVAAIAANLWPVNSNRQSRLSSFSYIFDELGSCDEREYIEPVVESLALEAHYLKGDDKWPLRNLAKWPVPRDPISLDPYFWLPIALMEAARDQGVNVMLSGHYGDMLFEGASYWAADMLRDGRLGEVIEISRKNPNSWREDVMERGLRQLLPNRWKQTFRRFFPRRTAQSLNALNPDFILRTGLEERMERSRGEDLYGAPGQLSRYLGLTLGYMPPTMATLSAIWQEFGIQLIEPMRDRRLAEFVFAIPADQLGLPGTANSKRILREAMRGYLPEVVRLRPTKTNYRALFEKGLLDKERATVEELLSQPDLLRRGYVVESWLEQTLPQGCGLSGDRYTLWRCVTLELWLRRYWNGSLT